MKNSTDTSSVSPGSQDSKPETTVNKKEVNGEVTLLPDEMKEDFIDFDEKKRMSPVDANDVKKTADAEVDAQKENVEKSETASEKLNEINNNEIVLNVKRPYQDNSNNNEDYDIPQKKSKDLNDNLIS